MTHFGVISVYNLKQSVHQVRTENVDFKRKKKKCYQNVSVEGRIQLSAKINVTSIFLQL